MAPLFFNQPCAPQHLLAQELERRGGPLPLALYASANRSPALAGQANDVDPVQMHRLPAKEFWAHFEARYGASPEMVGGVGWVGGWGGCGGGWVTGWVRWQGGGRASWPAGPRCAVE